MGLIPLIHDRAELVRSRRGSHLFHLFDPRLEIPPRRQRLATGPCLAHGATPARFNEADGNVKFAVQVPAEEIAGSGKPAPAALHHAGRTAGQPGALEPRLRRVGNLVGNRQQADAREIGLGDFVRDLAHPDAHFHVGLAGANPDIADEHIGDFCSEIWDFRLNVQGAAGGACRHGIEG